MTTSVTEELLSGKPPIPLRSRNNMPTGSITDELLSGGAQKTTVPKTAEEMPLGSLVVKARVPENQPDFVTHLKAATVDDPETKLGIYARDRFPEDPGAQDRYGYHKGNIVFIGNDGEVYVEAAGGFLNNFKKGAAELIARSPAMVLGTVGAVAGPGPSAAGAMLGEGIRKGVGRLAFDEPQTMAGNIKAIGTEGLYDIGGYAAGVGVSRGINYGLAKRGGRLATAAGRSRSTVDIDDVKRVENLGKKLGIDLLPPHTTQSRELIDKFNLLGDLPRTQDKIQAARRILAEQIDDAVYRYLDDIAPTRVTPMASGREAVEASGKALGRATRMKQDMTRPLYREAFKQDPNVDVAPVLEYINEELKNAKGKIRSSLLRAKTILLKPDLPKTRKPVELYDAFGKKIPLGAETSYETQLAGLHGAKMELDRMIETSQQNSLGRTVKRHYAIIQDKLLEQMDTASPKYKLARKAYASPIMSLEGEAVGSAVEDIARLEGEAVQNASKRLLSSNLATPETVLRARLLIKRENPKAWDAVVRTHIQNSLEEIKNNITDDAVNIGGHLYKKLFGNKRQRDILRAAMTHKQFETWRDLMDVLRRTGHTFRRESATATRQEVMRGMKKEGGSVVSSVLGTDLTAPLRGVSTWIDDALFGKYQDRLVDAMLSEKAAQQLKRLKQLNPKSEKFIKAFSTFMGMIVGGEMESRVDKKQIPIKTD